MRSKRIDDSEGEHQLTLRSVARHLFLGASIRNEPTFVDDRVERCRHFREVFPGSLHVEDAAVTKVNSAFEDAVTNDPVGVGTGVA